MNKNIDKIPFAVIQRLRLIDILLDKQAQLNRSTLAEYFGVSIVQTSADINLYNRLAPSNMVYNKSHRIYVPTSTFKRVWD